MAISQIYPFGVAGGANVVDLAAYLSSGTLATGFQTGPALSAYVNRALRQSSTMAAAVSQFIATVGGVDSLDNGDVGAQLAGLLLAVGNGSRASQAWNNSTAYPAGVFVIRNGETYVSVASNTNSAPPNTNWRTVGNDRLGFNVTGGANLTLTDLQSQYRILTFTGALSANIAVIVSNATPRAWFAVNVTTGSFTLTVRTAAGTGIAVPQGYGQWLWTDGTNVFAMSPPISTAGVTNLVSAIIGGSTQFTGTNTFTGASTWANTGLASFNSKNAGMGLTTTPGSLQVVNDPANSATSAAMLHLHRPGIYSVNFGLDIDNRLKWGGGSLGNNAYELWHALNAPGSVSTDSGYQILPNGFIIQASKTTTSVPSEGAYTVTFPIAFPTACITVVPCIRNTSLGSSVDYTAQYVSSTTSSVTIYAQESNNSPGGDPSGFTYIAIGY